MDIYYIKKYNTTVFYKKWQKDCCIISLTLNCLGVITMKDTVAIERMYKQLKKHITKEVSELTRADIDAFVNQLFQDKTYNSARFYVSVLNQILKYEKNNNLISMSDYEVNTNTKGLIKKSELIEIIEVLDSDQDKFILLALFNGIAGKQMTDLINLKKKDVDLNAGTITLSDRVVVMDDYFKKIAKNAMEQTHGIVISLSEDLPCVVEYEYNDKCENVIKVRPYSKNNNGLNPMSYNGMRTKIKDILDYIGLDSTVASIEKSGYLHKLNEVKCKKTVGAVEEFVKKNKIKVDGYNLFRLYKELY